MKQNRIKFDISYTMGLQIAKMVCKTLDSKLKNRKYGLALDARRKLELHIADVLFIDAYREGERS